MRVSEEIKNNVLLFDGAMGTYYAKEHPGVKCEEANLQDREAVLAIHRAYIDAGARAIKTNTFGANTAYLEQGFSYVKRVIEAGYTLAKEAIDGREIYLFADIGPLSQKGHKSAWQEYQQIVDVFLSCGAENFVFETLPSDRMIADICQYIKEKCPHAFILVQFAVTPDGYTAEGVSGRMLYKNANADPNIDAVGFNCVSGPLHLYEYVQTLPLGEKWLSVMPNAGYPTIMNGRTVFADNADYFCDKMEQIVASGARIIGGCCGTTPEHIRLTANMLSHFSPNAAVPRTAHTLSRAAVSDSNNPLWEKLQSGEKVIAVELDPPANTEIHFFMESARELTANGVDTITVADCPIARMRADSSLLSAKLKRELGICPLPHMTCRDRNLNATKALLLGLSIEEVNNILVVTGDPLPTAERSEIKSVYHFNSTKLAGYITDLNQTTLAHPFIIYGALNINATNFEVELKRAQQKQKNGMAVFLTQPLLSEEALSHLKKAREVLSAKILCGIIPVVSYKNACYMDNEIAGIHVSDAIKEQYREKSRSQAEDLAVTISCDMMQKAAPFCDGYYLITPFNRVALIQRILQNRQ